MSNGPVRESKYVACICGKVCKGRAGRATHGRKCPVDRVRSALYVYCASNDLPHVSDSTLMLNLLPIARALVEQATPNSSWGGMVNGSVLLALESGKY
jgi:hypothetical protein